MKSFFLKIHHFVYLWFVLNHHILILNPPIMKKIGFMLTVIAFFAFASLTSCNQAPKEEGTVEEAVVEEAVVEDDGVVEEVVEEAVVEEAVKE